MFSAGQIQEFA